MSATFPNGYDISGCKLVDKTERELSSDDLKNYTCCQCTFIIRDACQLSYEGDRICRICVPSEYVLPVSSGWCSFLDSHPLKLQQRAWSHLHSRINQDAHAQSTKFNLHWVEFKAIPEF